MVVARGKGGGWTKWVKEAKRYNLPVTKKSWEYNAMVTIVNTILYI